MERHKRRRIHGLGASQPEKLEERILLTASAGDFTHNQMVDAIIALDVYHRGYNTPGILKNSPRIYDYVVSSRSSQDRNLIDGLDHQQIGFFAQEYVSSAGDRVVAYRGTDDGFDTSANATSDIRNGFGIGAGVPHGPQGKAAVDFYNSIVGDGDPFNSSVRVTGQSLGGGLAGYVAALYDKDATVFSHMPFEQAAMNAFSLANSGSYSSSLDDEIQLFTTLQQYFGGVGVLDYNEPFIATRFFHGLPNSASLQPESVEDMRVEIWGDGPIVLPNVAGITSFHVKDEALYFGRLLACKSQESLVSLDIPETCVRGTSNEIAQARIGHFVEAHGEGLGLIHPRVDEKHFQSTFVISAFGHTQELNDDSWETSFSDIWPALFNESVAEAAGFWTLDKGENKDQAVGDEVGVKRPWNANGLMQLVLAYSVINQDGRPFGDSGIRALYDDAIELGNVLERTVTPRNLRASSPGLAEVVAQFGGQMARQAVLHENHPDLQPEQGVISFSKDGVRIPQQANVDETANADLLSINLSKALWNLTDLTEKRENDFGPDLDPNRPVRAEGLDEILINLFDHRDNLVDGSSEFAAAVEELYGDGEDNAGFSDRAQVAPYIARVDFSLENELPEVKIAELLDAELVIPAHQAGLYVSGDGPQRILGDVENNIIVGAANDDVLFGGFGKDILVGRRGNDRMIDLIAAPDPPNVTLPEDAHNDVYIGGENFELENWAAELLRRWKLSDVVYRLEHDVENFENEFDIVEYSVRSDLDDGVLNDLGLIVTDVDLTELGDIHAPKLTIHDPNTGRTSTDHFMFVDTILLSEKGDELYLGDHSWDVPAFVHLGDFQPGPIGKQDWDTVSFEDLSTGITMVNGVTRHAEPNGALPTTLAGKLLTIADALDYYVGFPPNEFNFDHAGFEQNHLLRTAGYEVVNGTSQDDTLYFNDVENLKDFYNDWPNASGRPTVGEIDGGGGHDVIFHQGGEYFAIGDEIPAESGGAPTFGADSVAAEELRMTVRGGDGDDRLMSAGGEGTILIGGDGRDFLFNTSFGGRMYGDSVDGVGQATEGAEDADVFWFWPGTFIMDAQPNDSLEMFGIPLLGGTNGLTGYESATGGGLAQDWLNWSTFYGQTSSDQLFVYNPIADMIVNAGSSRPPSRLSQVQVIEDFDTGGFRDNAFGVPEPGDLGMSFRFYVPPHGGQNISLFNDTWGHLISYIDVLANLAKRIRWQPIDDPLVIDLDGDGIETTSLLQSNAYFDLNADYFRDRTGWLAADDGFLVHDRNANGSIDDATELFGTPEVPAFEHLAQYDAKTFGGNGDGRVTADDDLFAELLVWRDLNQDGVSDQGELWSLAELDIVALDLDAQPLEDTVTPQGATLRANAQVRLSDDTTRNAYEAIFEVDPTDTIYRGNRGLADWLQGGLGAQAQVPDAKGFGAMANLAVDVSNDFDLAAVVADATQSMTTPTLRAVREAATPVFGAWSQSLERTRELTPVLVGASADGVTLLDQAIYEEDSAGGFWRLESGQPVLGPSGNAIARPSLQDVLAQSTGADRTWRLEEAFSPVSRSQPVAFRTNTAYLAREVDGRQVILDYAVAIDGGGWRLANLRDASGGIIAAATLEDLTATVPDTVPSDTRWRFEQLGHNPFAELPVERMGVQLVDGVVVDYTVQVTDQLGSFDVWARNLDRALELQHKYGTPEFSLRNYAVDLDALDATGSSDDSAYRVEVLTAGQFHFASSIFGIDFQPQVMYAETDPATGRIAYSVGSFRGEDAPTQDEQGQYESSIVPAIEMFDGLMQNYIHVSRAFAVRLALQGGLSDFARELFYDANTDEFRATGDRELAPFFEAIFEQAPAGAEAAYDYLVAWDEILDVIYPDYHLNESVNFVTGTMLRNQAFIFQMLLPAFETQGIDADLPAVLNALGVDETKLITHAPTDAIVEGTEGKDYFYVSTGNQTYRGGDDADIYFVGQNFGQDVIEDVEQPLIGVRAPDQLRFSHAKSTDVEATRDGLDLVIRVKGTDDVLRIKDQFEGENVDPLLGNDFSPDTEMVSIVFADGVIWERYQIAEAVSRALDSDDLVQGSQAKDILQGGRGSDVLRGGRDGDIYIYRQGDGDDRIADDNDRPADDPVAKLDLLQFGGDFNATDLRFFRDGESNDVEIKILDRDGNETDDRIYIEEQFQWISAPFLGLLFPNTIERFVFQDGSFLTDKDVMERVVVEATTEDADVIYGFHHADRLDGGLGDDVLIGRAQGDTYIYGQGYGNDVISDRDDDVFTESDDTLQFRDLRWSDLAFLREGDSPSVTLQVVGSDDSVTLEDQFRHFDLQGFINRIETLVFSDGTRWDWAKLGQHVIDLSVSAGNDRIYGFDIDDRLDAGAGDDRLEGGLGADTYIFARGYGHDQIFDTASPEQGDRLVLEGIALDDVEVGRDGEDLIFTVRDTGETVTLIDQFARDQRQTHAIETFQFADVTVDFRSLNAGEVDVVGTAASETIIGSDFAETFDGRGGDDTLIGKSDGDTYLFGRGYGQDEIIDQQTRVAWTNRDGSLAKETDDTIRFGTDLSLDAVAFTKDGSDLLISITNATDTLRVKQQFESIEHGVEWFDFSDGVTLHISDVEEQLAIVGASWGDDVLVGVVDAPNSLDGRQGDDVLMGGDLADQYAFGAAYDLDQIIESATPVPGSVDRVVFSASVDPRVVQLSRNEGTLVVDLGNGEDQLTIVDGLTDRQVELFSFADGTEWTVEQIRERLLTGSEHDDTLVGFDDRNDRLDGRGGSDRLDGGLGDDDYVFDVGSGKDAIWDTGGWDRLLLGPSVSVPMLHLSQQDGDLLVRFEGYSDSVIIAGGVSSVSGSNRIEEFVFDDGTVVGIEDILRALIADSSTPGDDVIVARLGVPVEVDAGPGNDLILGQADTSLRFGLGDGADVYDARDQRGSSRFILEDFASTDAHLRRIDLDGPDVLIAFPPTGDQLLVRGALDNTNVSEIAFADGVSWTHAEFVELAIQAQATDRDDVITGSQGDDRIHGLLGDDDIEGGFGNDTYFFHRGDGRDRISDVRGFDVLELRGYRPSDVSVSVPVQDRSEIQLVFAGTPSDSILLPFSGLTGVDFVRFGDGTEWTMAELQDLAIGQGTPFDDQVFGNAADNEMNGGPGNDWLQGEDGSDVYHFQRGGGRDIINDNGRVDDINRLVIHDYVPADVSVVTWNDRINDLTLRFSQGDEVTIVGGLLENGWHVAQFAFEDGTQWTLEDARNAANANRDSDADETISGTNGPDTLHGAGGNDWLSGRDDSDVYLFRAGDGQDVIDENGQYDTDVLRIEGYRASDATFQASLSNAADLVIGFPGTQDRITVVNTLDDVIFDQVEIVEFAGVSSSVVALTMSEIRQRVIEGQQTSGDDTLIGYATNDVLSSGPGWNRMTGRDGSDTYVYRPGDGREWIDDNGNLDTDVLRIEGYKISDTSFARSRFSDHDLVVRFAGNPDDEVTIVNTLNGDRADQVESIVFVAGDPLMEEALSIVAVRQMLLDALASPADDQLIGFVGPDVLAGGAGHDYLSGGDGSDVYEFHRGDGADTIEDRGDRDTDVLRIHGYTMADALLAPADIDPDSLWIRFRDTQDQILVADTLPPNAENVVERFEFDGAAPGTTEVLSIEQMRATLLTNAWPSEYVRTTGSDTTQDTLRGGPGKDLLSGLDQSDTYVFAAGDGQDIIDENGYLDTDVLRIEGYDEGQVRLSQDVLGNLVILFVGSTDQIVVSRGAEGTQPDRIERIQIGDVVWDETQIRAKLLETQATDGNDRLLGIFTDDVLAAGLGNDVLHGRDGSDLYLFRRGDGHDIIEDNGFLDTDIVRIEGWRADEMQLSRQGDDLTLSFPGSDDRIDILNTLDGNSQDQVEQIQIGDESWSIDDVRRELLRVEAERGLVRLTGFLTDDVLQAGPGQHVLSGFDGSDTYVFLRGDGQQVIDDNGAFDVDVVQLLGYTTTELRTSRALHAEDNLILTFFGSDDRLEIVNTLAGSSQDQIERFQFDDQTLTIDEMKARLLVDRFTDGDDVIVGTDVDDTLVGGWGNDQLQGGLGVDVYRYRRGDGFDVILDPGALTEHTDTLQLVGVLPVHVSLQRGLENDLEVIIAESNVDTRDAGRVRVRNSFLSTGTAGIAKIVFDDGTIWSRDQFESLAERNVATSGNDHLEGTTGNDTLEGLAGDDRLVGFDGNDTYVVRAGSGRDQIRDAGGGMDVIEVHGFALEQVAFSRQGRDSQDLLIELDTQGDAVVVINGLAGNERDRIEEIRFADFGEQLEITQVWQRVVAGNRSAEADQVLGTVFDDTLNGGGGADLLIGRGGNDHYVYHVGDGDVRITDGATDAADRLQMVGLASSDLLDVRRSPADGMDLVLAFPGGVRVTVTDALGNLSRGVESIAFGDGVTWDVSAMRAAVLQFASTPQDSQIRGFAGDDLLVGGRGDDLLMGGPGNDVYRFEVGDGRDVVDDRSDSPADRVEITGYGSHEVTVSRLFRGSDSVVLEFAGGRDALTIHDALSEDYRGIELIAFEDNALWTRTDLLRRLDNRVPIASEDGIFAATQGQSLVLPVSQLLSNDYDADGESLDIIAVQANAGHAVEQNGGDIVFTPAEGYDGAAEFSYTVSDGRNGLATGVVNIRVNPLAQARDDAGLSVAEDELLSITANRLLANDIDGDRMVIAQVLDPQHGNVSFASNGTISFTPDPDYAGPAGFRYIANTPAGGRAEASVAIEVLGTNDPPLAADDAGFVTDEEEPISIAVTELLANDIDVDGDTISLVAVQGNENLAVALEADGSIRVAPAPYFFGVATFTYTVQDLHGAQSAGSVAIEVRPVNNPPAPGIDELVILEDEPILIPVAMLLENDVDYDSDSLEITFVARGGGGNVEFFEGNGTILFTPLQDWSGQAYFYYTVDDGHGGIVESGVAVQVDPVNDAPAARNETYATDNVFFLNGAQDQPLRILVSDLLQNDVDVDGLQLTLASVADAENGVAVVDGEHIVFTPSAGYWGEAVFRYVVKDEGDLVDDASVTMYFAPTGSAPPVAVNDQVTMIEDVTTTIAAAGLLGNDRDLDGDGLELTRVTMPAEFGVAQINDAGDVVVTPATNHHGFAYFDYTVTDHVDGEDTARVTLDILPVNDAPTAGHDVATTSLAVPLVLRIADLLANDTDVDLRPEELSQLTFVGVRSASHGSVSIFQDEFVVVEYPAGFSGAASLEYTVADELRIEDDGTVTIFVQEASAATLRGSTRADLIYGSPRGETIEGLAGDDDLFGRGGMDVFLPGDGADRVDGGDGRDTVDMAGSPVGVRADLESRIGQGGFAQGDEYLNIESLLGSVYDDELGGDGAANHLEGRAGNDVLLGRNGADTLRGGEGDDRFEGGPGPDAMEGGPGSDTADYRTSHGPVVISLESGSAAGGDADGDQLIEIENLGGTDYDDVLIGSSGPNTLTGYRGRDLLRGGDGDDILIGGRDPDVLDGGPGWDQADYRLSASGIVLKLEDPIAGGGDAWGDVLTSIEVIVGSSHDDQIIGDEQDNTIIGGLGADVLDGAGGLDVLSYAYATAPVDVDLEAGRGFAGEATGDVLRNFEQLVGSDFDDRLAGGAKDETFRGGPGNDRLVGGFGSDRYEIGFDAGSDVIVEQGDSQDVDRVLFNPNVRRSDVSVTRDGDDLLVVLEQGEGLLEERLRVTQHFLGPASGVEELLFADGTTWDRADIEAFLRPSVLNAADDIIRFATEDETLVILAEQLLRNDVSEWEEELRIVSVSSVENASVSVQADGSVRFMAAPDFHGDAFFEYTVQDPTGRASTARVEVTVLAVNDGPIAGDDGLFWGTEDTPLSIPISALLANDVDVDGDVLRLTGNFGPLLSRDGQPISPTLIGTNGEPAIVGNDVVFRPALDHFGFAGFQYEVTDGRGETATAQVELRIVGENDGPRTMPDSGFARLGRRETIRGSSLMFNDEDPESDAFSVTAVHSAVNGTVQLRQETEVVNGSQVPVTWIDFDAAALGTASYQYEVTDVWGATSIGSVNLNVIPLNDPPIARNDGGFTTTEDTPLRIDPVVLLENDIDPENDPLSITGFERFPWNGTVEFDQDGMIVFSPRANYNGPAGFRYIVDDGHPLGTDSAFVSVEIGLANDGPVLLDDVLNGIEDEPIVVRAGEAFRNDVDPEGDVLFFASAEILGVLKDDFSERARIVQSHEETLPAGARVEMASAEYDEDDQLLPLPSWLTFDLHSGFGRNGDASYDPAAPAFDVAITYYSPDGGPPLPWVMRVDPADFASLPDVPRRPRVLRGGTLVDSGLVTASLWNGSPLPDWLEFDPGTLKFRASEDNPNTNSGPVRVRVSYPALIPERPETELDEVADPVPGFALEMWVDPAEIASPTLDWWLPGDTSLAGPLGNHLSWLLPPDVAITASTAEQTPLPSWLEFDPDTLTFAGTPPDHFVGVVPVRIDVGPSEAAGTSAVALITELYVDTYYDLAPSTSGFAAHVTDDSVNLIRPPDFHGTFLVAYHARDEKGGVSAEPATIFVNVEPQREVPVARPDAFEVEEDQVLRFAVRDLLANDFDGDDDAIRVVEIHAPETGVLETAASPISLELPDQSHLTGALTRWTEVAGGGTLPDWLSFDPQSGRLFGTPPLGVSVDSVVYVVTEDSAVPSRRESVKHVIQIDGTSDLTATYVPPSGFSGPVPMTYTITDDSEGTDTGVVTIHVLPRRDPPIANDDFLVGEEDTLLTVPVSALLANDTDVDGDALQVIDVIAGEHGEVELIRENGNGYVAFEPEPNYDGNAWFRYSISDGSDGEATGRVDVWVLPNNRPPVTVVDRLETQEDVPVVVSLDALLANDFDPDGDELVFHGLEARGTNGNAVLRPDGRYDLAPRGDYSGEVTFTYQVTDGRLRSAETRNIVLHVTPVNDAPVANDDAGFATDVNMPLVVPLSLLLENDSDVDGDPLTVIRVLDPVNGSVGMAGGLAVFTPRADYVGNGGFAYEVTDGRGGTGQGFVSLEVRSDAGSLPIAVSDAFWEMDEDTFLDIQPSELLANDVDLDGDPLTFVSASGPGVTMLPDQTIRFRPAPDANGRFKLDYQISDGQEVNVTGHFFVDVRPVDEPPRAVDDELRGVEDTPLIIPVALLESNDADRDGHAIGIVAVGSAVGGTAELDQAGNIRFTPAADHYGFASFGYTLQDATGATDTARVRIRLGAVNDAPVAVADEITTARNQPVLINLIKNDLDVDDNLDAATLVLVSAPSHGRLANHSNGSFTYWPDPDYVGLDRFQYGVSDSLGAASAIADVMITVRDEDTVSPEVVGLFVDSQEWLPVFRDYVDDSFAGTALGKRLPLPGAGKTMPWTGLDVIRVQFSEDVGSSLDERDFRFEVAGDVVVQGGAGPIATPAIDLLQYDPLTFTATLWLEQALDATVFDFVVLREGIHDAEGNPLSSSSSTRSDFAYRMSILPGDVDGSGNVDADDVRLVTEDMTAFLQSDQAFQYQARADLDGTNSTHPDGPFSVIDGTDLQLVRDRVGSAIVDSALLISAAQAERQEDGDDELALTRLLTASAKAAKRSRFY